MMSTVSRLTSPVFYFQRKVQRRQHLRNRHRHVAPDPDSSIPSETPSRLTRMSLDIQPVSGVTSISSLSTTVTADRPSCCSPLPTPPSYQQTQEVTDDSSCTTYDSDVGDTLSEGVILSDENVEAKLDHKDVEEDVCTICLEIILSQQECKLPCSHVFHKECISQLRAFANLCQTCPVCRAELPESADEYYSEGIKKYIAVERWMEELGLAETDEDFQEEMEDVAILFQRAADQGHMDAMINLGFMYSRGRGLEQSFEEALHWYTKASEQGSSKAMFNLGIMYRTGRGVGVNDVIAFDCFNRSAENDYAPSQIKLAAMYLNGSGVIKSLKNTVYWYTRAAEQGNVEACRKLGDMYRWGKAVPQNWATCFHWEYIAASKGNVVSQRHVGEMYRNGEGVPVNLEEAADWLRKAAMMGDTPAQLMLSKMYEKGHGVAQSTEEALFWSLQAVVMDQPQSTAARLSSIIETPTFSQ